jgi:hypothetical protein
MAKHVTTGEGFAFFRWHCLRFPWSFCHGINDPRPGVGLDGCVYLWRRRRNS